MGATVVPMFQRGAESRPNIGFPLGIARSLPCAACLRAGIISRKRFRVPMALPF